MSRRPPSRLHFAYLFNVNEAVEIEGMGLRRAEQMGEERQGRPVLLAAGFEKAEQDALGVGPSRGAVAAPHLACDHHGVNRLFAAPVGGFQARAVQEGEQRIALPPKMVRQTLMMRRTPAPAEQAIHAGFQSSPRHRQPVSADLAVIATLAQAERRLQNRPHCPREQGAPTSADFDTSPGI